MTYTLSQWVMFFYVYSLLGWIWESAYVSICKCKLVNRGFLKGPFLPIYGSGAVCILVVTLPVRGNIPAMILVGMAAATVLEYVTGAVMEKLFHVRYWDYTGNFLNVNGYICLKSTLCWGAMTVLVVDVFQVRIEQIVCAVNEKYITGIVIAIMPILTADFVTSFRAAIQLRDMLVQGEKIKEELHRLTEKKNELENMLMSAGEKAKAQILAELQDIMMRTGQQKERLRIASVDSIKGLLKRNPMAMSRWHKESFAELKQAVMEKRQTVKDKTQTMVEKTQNVREKLDAFWK